MSEPIWMFHAETGNYAQMPDLPYWRAHGWEPAEAPPPEPDLLHDPGVEPEQFELPPDEDPEDSSGSFADQPDEAVTSAPDKEQ
jgi:hypothetical protein